MHYCCASGNVASLKILIAAGANPKACTKKGNTPLHFASFLGHLECISELIKVPGVVEIADKGRRTALHFSAVRGLVENPSSIEKLKSDTSTYEAMHTDMQLLKANGLADTHCKRNAVGRYAEGMKMLLAAGASVAPRTAAAGAGALLTLPSLLAPRPLYSCSLPPHPPTHSP